MDILPPFAGAVKNVWVPICENRVIHRDAAYALAPAPVDPKAVVRTV
jgi:hypothetical protein